MTRLLAAAMLLSSGYEAYKALPGLAAQMPNRAALGLSATVWITFAIEVFLCAIFLLVPWLAGIAPSIIHFGSRRLSDYTPAQLERVLPVVHRMMDSLCVLVTFFRGSACICASSRRAAGQRVWRRCSGSTARWWFA